MIFYSIKKKPLRLLVGIDDDDVGRAVESVLVSFFEENGN